MTKKQGFAFLIAIVLVGFYLHWNNARMEKLMEIDYCFYEDASGEVQHYVCDEQQQMDNGEITYLSN